MLFPTKEDVEKFFLEKVFKSSTKKRPLQVDDENVQIESVQINESVQKRHSPEPGPPLPPPVFENDDDSMLSDLENSEEEQDTGGSSPGIENFPELHAEFMRKGEEIWNTKIPKRPILPSVNPTIDHQIDLAYYNLYFSVQYAIIYHKFDGEIPPMNFMEDLQNPEMMEDKIFYLNCSIAYQNLTDFTHAIAEHMANTVRARLSPQDPVCIFMENLFKHQELHSRRLKLDPGIKERPTYNAVTGERYDSKNKDHKKWRLLFIYPLATDYDSQAIDDVVAAQDEQHDLAIKAAKLMGERNVPEPFGIVVNPDWDKVLRIIHIMYYFTDYLFQYIVSGIDCDTWASLQHMDREETWETLMGEFGELPRLEKRDNQSPIALWVAGLKKEKKNVPVTIFRMTVLRDLLTTGIKFKY